MKFLLAVLSTILITTGAHSQVVINEFMALNNQLTGILDPAGEAADWVELYNTTNNTVQLGGWFMSDTLPVPNKWQIPVGVAIAANGYLIVWCDNQLNQEGLHANFKLKSEGEDLLLANPNLTIVDQITYGQQQQNTSMQRIPNGTGPFIIAGGHTFNGPNSTVSTDDRHAPVAVRISKCDNLPCITFDEAQERASVAVFTANGQLMAGRSLENIQVGEAYELGGYYTTGIYFIQVCTASGCKTLRYYQGR